MSPTQVWLNHIWSGFVVNTFFTLDGELAHRNNLCLDGGWYSLGRGIQIGCSPCEHSAGNMLLYLCPKVTSLIFSCSLLVANVVGIHLNKEGTLTGFIRVFLPNPFKQPVQNCIKLTGKEYLMLCGVDKKNKRKCKRQESRNLKSWIEMDSNKIQNLTLLFLFK